MKFATREWPFLLGQACRKPRGKRLGTAAQLPADDVLKRHVQHKPFPSRKISSGSSRTDYGKLTERFRCRQCLHQS